MPAGCVTDALRLPVQQLIALLEAVTCCIKPTDRKPFRNNASLLLFWRSYDRHGCEMPDTSLLIYIYI